MRISAPHLFNNLCVSDSVFVLKNYFRAQFLRGHGLVFPLEGNIFKCALCLYVSVFRDMPMEPVS